MEYVRRWTIKAIDYDHDFKKTNGKYMLYSTLY